MYREKTNGKRKTDAMCAIQSRPRRRRPFCISRPRWGAAAVQGSSGSSHPSSFPLELEWRQRWAGRSSSDAAAAIAAALVVPV